MGNKNCQRYCCFDGSVERNGLRLELDILLQIPYRKLRYYVWRSGLLNDVDEGQENSARSSRSAVAQTLQAEGTSTEYSVYAYMQ